MKKIFGFLVILMASASVSQAALLASWTFDTNSAGAVNPGSGLGGTTEDFTNFGTAPATAPTTTTSGRPGTNYYGINGARVSSGSNSNTWRTGYIFNPVDDEAVPPQTIFDVVDTTKGNKFSYTSTQSLKDLLIQSLDISLATAIESPQPGTMSTISSVMVYTSIGGGAFSYLGKVSNASTTMQTVSLPVNLTLSAGQKVEFAFSYVGNAGTNSGNPRNFRYAFDKLELNGEERLDVVPEPTSMAVFALTLGGLAVRRRLKK